MRVGPFDVKGKRTGDGEYDVYVFTEENAWDKTWTKIGRVTRTPTHRRTWRNTRQDHAYRSKWGAMLNLVDAWNDAELRRLT